MECLAIDRPGGFTLTDKAVASCGFPPGARLLDVGCGSGATVRHLIRDYGLDAHGIDKAPCASWNRANLSCACGEHIPFRDGETDGVLLECSLSVMHDPNQVLKECHRILKPRAYLVLSDLYARGEAADLKGCLGRVDTRETILRQVASHGFEIQCFEDFSEHLLTLWGQKLFEKGAAAFCAELGTDKGKLKAMNCGYFLIVARKECL